MGYLFSLSCLKRSFKEELVYHVRFANPIDAPAIAQICSQAWRITYKDLYSQAYIDKVIAEFYNLSRVEQECQTSSADWHGYMVAEKDGEIVGCIGGACEDETGFIYVLYVKPSLKGQGIGTALLDGLTHYQKGTYSIRQQDVYVTAGNQMGIPFYEKNGFQCLQTIPNWIDDTEGFQCRYRRLV